MGTKPQGSVVLVSRDDGMFWNVLEYILMSVVMSRCPPVPMTGRGGNLREYDDVYYVLLARVLDYMWR